MASAASSLSAKERREQAAAARGTTLSNSGSSEKSQLGSMGKTGQIFTPHIVNIASGEVMILTKTDYFHDLAQSKIFSFPFFKLRLFARRFKLKEFSDAESCQIDLVLQLFY
ncbi:hypothetical protein DY000_02024549 [Brassica cretica]|uniref:AT-hook motif nuclear-localized protein n=1 Tax=Brassica cretica TaxID=69181 RepID=A0ABQ7E5D0_BRACR|nr:hypothetical protein DY000_02024549 [Brassica cretica]